MSDLGSVWQRIAQWHRDHLPESLRGDNPSREFLNSGASAEVLAAAEQSIGLTFPVEVREAYRLHDGSRDGYAILPWGFHLLPLAGVVESWRMWQAHVKAGLWDGKTTEPKGSIRPVHWNTRWVPVSHNNGGDHQCVDLDPALGGTIGQIIGFSHEVGPLRVLATSFGGWLQGYAIDLEAGGYRYDPDELWVVPVHQP